jgi:ubiquinone/menaquinone biosynthesis C-methylase UbiE
MDVAAYLADFYSGDEEENRLLTPHGRVEYLTTMRFIEKYLQPGMTVLEVGAGTGRYSLPLAERVSVTAVELLPHNVAQLTAKVTDRHHIAVHQGNATNLSFLPDNAFDITLVLGPLYHLFTPEDKKQALAEALRVTKPGGLLFVAYCMSDATILDWGFLHGNIGDAIEKGMVDAETFRCYSEPALIFELYRREDIDALMADFPVERLHYVGVDMASGYTPMREALAAMDDAAFATYLAYHFSICERPDMVGVTHHSLDVSLVHS